MFASMPSAVEIAVDTYIRAWREPDPRIRASLVEACFADNGRFVTRSATLDRSALLNLMAKVHADPQLLRLRLTSVIDARGTTFRFRAVADNRDGSSSAETLDAGEIDASGRISLVLTFTGPLPNAEDGDG